MVQTPAVIPDADVPIRSLYKYEARTMGGQGAALLQFHQFRSQQAREGTAARRQGHGLSDYERRPPLRIFRKHGGQIHPVNETVDLQLGNDAEVSVKPTLTDWQKTDLRFDRRGNVTGWTTHEAWTLDLQNSKEISVFLDIRRNSPAIGRSKHLLRTKKIDTTKIKIPRPLKIPRKAIHHLRLTTRHGTNATR